MNDWYVLLSQPAAVVAPRLLGGLLIRELDGQRLVARIVETEAYDQTDAASHSYRGRTPRTDVMFGRAGHLYVYFTYGMHYCFNVVTAEAGEGSAVLIRAVEPLEGLDEMRRNRGKRPPDSQLTNGPAKLCQALGIDKSWNGHDLRQAPLRLQLEPSVPSEAIQITTRIGISRAEEMPWRFYLKGNLFVSVVAKST